MKYNFNEEIDRKNNHSAKWSEMKKIMEAMICGLCG